MISCKKGNRKNIELWPDLDADHGGVGPLVALQGEGSDFGVQHLPGQVNQPLGLVDLAVVNAEHSAVKSSVLTLKKNDFMLK